MENRQYFNPTPGTIYENKGGGSYLCLSRSGHFEAKFQRVSKYKWTGSALVVPPEPILFWKGIELLFVNVFPEVNWECRHCTGSFGCAILLPALSATAIAFAKPIILHFPVHRKPGDCPKSKSAESAKKPNFMRFPCSFCLCVGNTVNL